MADPDASTLTDTTGPPLRVLIVDDSAWLRQHVRGALEHAGLVVVGEAGDGANALAQAAAQHPDVVLMDLRMPGMDGVQATRELLVEQAGTIVLLLAADGEESLVLEALMAGARGYLRKAASAAEVVDTVMPGVVSIPHGWGHDVDGIRMSVAAEHAGSNSNVLADEEQVDPLSGNAVLNGIPVEVTREVTQTPV